VSEVRFHTGPPRNNTAPIDPGSWGFLMCVLYGAMAEYWDPRGGDVESCVTILAVDDKLLERGAL